MKEMFIVTGTVTYAMRAKEILTSKGYFADVRKWNDQTGKYGCGYGVKIKTAAPYEAKNILLENGIRIIDIIVQTK